MAVLQEVDPPVVHLPSVVLPLGLRDLAAEGPLQGEATVLAVVRSKGRRPEGVATKDEGPPCEGDVGQAMVEGKAMATAHEDQGVLLTGIRPALRPILGEDRVEVAEGALQVPSRDRPVVPVPSSNAADGAVAAEVGGVGPKVPTEGVGAVEPRGQEDLAQVLDRDAAPAVAAARHPDAVEGAHPLEDGRRLGVEVEGRRVGEARRPEARRDGRGATRPGATLRTAFRDPRILEDNC